EAGKVREHELVVVAVRDPEDAAPRRLRLVGDDRHLAAAERVHERRLADVRPPSNGDESRPHPSGRFHVSGRSSPGAYSAIVPSSRRKKTRSTRHSCSHCRQPPHGEAVTPIAARSPGRSPSLAACAIAVRSAHTPSGYAAFSTLTPSKTRPSRARRLAPTR